ncbi:GNAT family N-acetyltransferase [Anaerostipes sp.]|uniref:GNAT family N-acetyltransferase n=1 Tax=Anaerostipes sp. TaxID=1872530 RepID=UPI0025BAD843|nr:GNAT family N-acetyltransferase [Anaerostipes sp.]MBS7008764.1 GNAT family N-acetyltransferase [Anaerostipes sp.]
MKITYLKKQNLFDDAKNIREEVFVKEQGFVNEIDDTDKKAVHIVCYDQERPIAVGRYFQGEEKGVYNIGRVAIIKEYRGRQIGRYIMEVMEQNIRKESGRTIYLSAQARVQDFYKKLGYTQRGEAFMEEHCLHIPMKKDLREER